MGGNAELIAFTQDLNPGDPDSPDPAGGQLISPVFSLPALQPQRVLWA